MTRTPSFARRVAVLVLFAGLALQGCGRKQPGPLPTVPVTAGLEETRAVPLSLNAVGVVEPIEAVIVKALVGGVLDRVGFKEGDEVKAGQVLFLIDPRPYDAQLRVAEAQLARDRAQAANIQTQAERYARLAAEGYVSKEQEESARTQAQAMSATVQLDEAAVEQARLARA